MTASARPAAPRVAFVASEAEAAQQALAELQRLYPCVDPEHAEIIVPLGGDGFMLETLHRFLPQGVPIFGMHRGSVGFLMNPYRLDGLVERLAAAQPVVLHPLEMAARDEHGSRHARSPSTRCRCCARAARRQSCGSASTASCGSTS